MEEVLVITRNVLEYRGYEAKIEVDLKDNILFGTVLGIRDSIGFHADNVADIKKEFKENIDAYLNTCKDIGKNPEQSKNTLQEKEANIQNLVQKEDKVYCHACRDVVPYTVHNKELTGQILGETYSYVGKIARCLRCNSEVYVPELLDFNLDALYQKRKQKKIEEKEKKEKNKIV